MIKIIYSWILSSIIKNKKFWGIYGMLLIYYFTFLPAINEVYLYNFTFYALSYKWGFISRGLIGHLFNIIFTVVSIKKVYFILNFIFIFFLMFVAYMMNLIINIYKNKLMGLMVALLCVFNPASFMLMITMSEFGRFDIFIFILTIISLIFLYKNKYLFLIPIISILAMLTHQNFIFMYAPLICTLIIYHYFKNKEKKWITLLVVNLLCLVLSLSVVLVYGKPESFKTSTQFATVLRRNTNIPITDGYLSAIHSEYYKTFADHMNWTAKRMSQAPKRYFAIGLVLLLSYLYIQYILLYQFIIKKNKLFYYLILSCFGSLILFIIGHDFGRWYVAIINSLVLLFIYLIFENIKILNSAYKSLKGKEAFLIMAIIYYILLMQNSRFLYMEFEKINKIINHIQSLWPF